MEFPRAYIAVFLGKVALPTVGMNVWTMVLLVIWVGANVLVVSCEIALSRLSHFAKSRHDVVRVGGTLGQTKALVELCSFFKLRYQF
jgi:hypothetical protein